MPRVRRVRARIEKVFGTIKRCYGLRRMRWLGLAKAGLQVRLAALGLQPAPKLAFACAMPA
jgi:IS5 family transposase